MSEGRLDHILRPTPMVACVLDDHRWTSRANSTMRRAMAMRKPGAKAIAAMRSRIRGALRMKGAKKSDASIKLLGCTPNHLRLHLEAKFPPAPPKVPLEIKWWG